MILSRLRAALAGSGEPTHCPTCGGHPQDNGQCPFCLKAHRMAGHDPDNFAVSLASAPPEASREPDCGAWDAHAPCDLPPGHAGLHHRPVPPVEPEGGER